MNGFVVLDKEAGMTSFQSAAFVRKLYQEKKTGHTGTLDPMATGVLPVALGRATRFIDLLPDHDKAYLARFRLGVATDTLDITGTVLRTRPVHADAAAIEALLPRFTGEIEQTPPMYSALRVNGKRLYELARAGEEIDRAARRITVYSLTLTGRTGENEYELAVECSKGTYVRSLAADLGEARGCGAVLTALRRTKANGFTLAQARSPEALAADPAGALLPTEAPFTALPAVRVTEKQATRFLNGGALSADRLSAPERPGRVRVLSPDGVFLGLGTYPEERTGALIPLRVTDV